MVAAFSNSKENEEASVKTNAPRWTFEEDEIARQATNAAAAAKLLPGRPLKSIRKRRREFGLRVLRRWTKIEDERLIQYQHEPLIKQEKRFRRRTLGAIESRRKALRLSPRVGSEWLGSEIKRLKSLYPNSTRVDVLAAFPRHNWEAIQRKALSLGWYRETHLKLSLGILHEQVRRRAREDGIAMRKLGMEINCGSYFCSQRNRDDYNKIARAVEFFGGRLVIDWQDE